MPVRFRFSLQRTKPDRQECLSYKNLIEEFDYEIFVWPLKAIFQPSPRFKNNRRCQLLGFAAGFRP